VSVFDQPFLFLRTPGGNVEDLDRMQAAGFRGVFCNVREHEAAEWEVVRRKALARGMFCGPWAHTMNAARAFSFDVLDKIIETADRWRSPLIVNSEKELDNSGSTLTRVIAERVGGRDAAISMQAFLFFSVEWTPVKHLPMLLQIFPAESIAAKDPLGCRERAWNAGCERVYLTFGSYREQHPGLYRLQEPYSVYTGDDCGNDYQAWSPTSSGYQATRQVTPNPPPRPPEPPPLPVVTVPLPRPVRLRRPYMMGVDVTAHKRAVYRYLGATYAWKKLTHSNVVTRRTYGGGFDKLVNDARHQSGLPEGRGVDAALYTRLRAKSAYLPYEDSLLLRYAAAHPVLSVCNPIPLGHSGSVCQDLHQTAGLPGNWAIDFCANPNTPVVACEAGVVTRFSGHDPTDDQADRDGVFGYTVYFRALRTYEYFVTHLGRYPTGLSVGDKVVPGTVIGYVGDQRYRIDHTHYGVSSTLGQSDAKKRITAVKKAPKTGAK